MIRGNMSTKLITPFFAWLLGKPLRSKLGKWTEGILIAIFSIFLVYACIWGPMVILMPFAPPGFSSLSDGINTVYFQGDTKNKAQQVLQQAQDAQLAVLRFWEGPEATVFPSGGTRVYLCNSPEVYHRLTLNRAAGCVIFDKALYLDMTKQAVRKTTPNDLRHEFSHVYLARHLGLIKNLFGAPKWFDEGCAATLADLPWQSPSHLSKYLTDSPGLTSPLDLESYSEWLMASRNGGWAVLKQYAHVRRFVEYLVTKHGQQKIVEYLHTLSLSSSSASRFEEVFGVPLDIAHEDWLSGMKEAGHLPSTTNVVRVSPPTSIRIIVPVALILVIVVLLMLIRQLSRTVRLAVRFIPEKMKEDS
jgi:hypothetical protein